MAYLKVASSTFEQAFGTGADNMHDSRENTADRDGLPGSFMTMLTDYLRGRKEWTARAIYTWVRSGGKLCAFTCREDLVQPVIDVLMERGRPFVLVKESTGGTGFLIRDADRSKVKADTEEVLQAHAGYCEITTGEGAGIIYRGARVKDKNMLVLGGLSGDEIFYLQEEARTALPGLAVGIDCMPDGTFTMTCHGESAFEPGSRFGRSLIEAVMLAGGECTDEIRERRTRRKAYLREKAAGFPDKNGALDSPVWIVGTGECYVKKTQDGFELGHAEEVCGETFLVIDAETGVGEDGYERKLDSALSRMTGHMCLYEESSVLEYFRNKKDHYRGSKENGIKTLVGCASGVVSERKKRFPKSRSWAGRMARYRDDMYRLLEGAGRGSIPRGYRKKDILRLRRIIQAFGLDMEKAQPALTRMRDITVHERQAGPRRIDLEQKLAVLHGRPEEQLRGETSRGRDQTKAER